MVIMRHGWVDTRLLTRSPFAATTLRLVCFGGTGSVNTTFDRFCRRAGYFLNGGGQMMRVRRLRFKVDVSWPNGCCLGAGTRSGEVAGLGHGAGKSIDTIYGTVARD